MSVFRRAMLLASLPFAAAHIVGPAAIADSTAMPPYSRVTRPCVDVEIAGERAPDYGCLTDALRRTLDATTPIANAPPIKLDANPNAIGLITPTQVRQQYGPNFGNSVVPYRPQQTYPIPLVTGRQ